MRRKLKGVLLAQQIEEAKELIHAHGIPPDADPLLPSHTKILHLWRVLAPQYHASAYRRASVEDHLLQNQLRCV